jgi:hypothetical protein
MKTILITIAIVSSIYTYDAVTEVTIVHTQPIEVVEDIVKVSDITRAIIQVESRGNDSAYNKSEDAVGCLQIRPIMVREVNRLLKIRGEERRYTLKDRWNRQKSIEMFLVFNRNISNFEEQCRRWNGGHNGMKKTATIKYWNKVKKKLINNK